MKKYLAIFLAFIFIISGTQVSAKTVPDAKELNKQIRQQVNETIKKEIGTDPAKLRQQIQDEVQNKIKEQKNQIQQDKKSLLDQIKDKIKNLRFSVRITGTLKSVSGNTLTVTGDDGKDYRVNVSGGTNINVQSNNIEQIFNTILRRKFWGKANLSEFVAGNKVNVIGKWHDDTKTQVDAYLVRNLSIEKRWGVFMGDVVTKNSDNFVIKSGNKGNQTVYFDSNTKFIARDEKPLNYNDVQVGHRVRVKGVWDNKLNKITEVSEVKDFILPVKPSVSPAPSTAPSPTPID